MTSRGTALPPSGRGRPDQGSIAGRRDARPRSRPRRRTAGADGGAHDGSGMGRWLLTYSDMITLLLALFIILFAISTINGKKFVAFKEGLTQSFTNKTVHPRQSSSLLPDQNGLSDQPRLTTALRTRSDLSGIDAAVVAALGAAGLSKDTSVTVTKQGVVVQIFADMAYFATDGATLQPVGDQVVDTISGVLKTVPNQVEVQGYTDDEPITGGPYVSNWELSAARAASAVSRLETHDGIAAARLSAVGFGTTHPIASNATAPGRSENRRVDIVILTTAVPAPGTTGTPRAGGSA